MAKNINWVVVFSFVAKVPTSPHLVPSDVPGMVEVEVRARNATEAIKDARDVFWIDLQPNADDGTLIANAGPLTPIGVFPAPEGYVAGQ